jgi:hypothetical protein
MESGISSHSCIYMMINCYRFLQFIYATDDVKSYVQNILFYIYNAVI